MQEQTLAKNRDNKWFVRQRQNYLLDKKRQQQKKNCPFNGGTYCKFFCLTLPKLGGEPGTFDFCLISLSKAVP